MSTVFISTIIAQSCNVTVASEGFVSKVQISHQISDNNVCVKKAQINAFGREETEETGDGNGIRSEMAKITAVKIE